VTGPRSTRSPRASARPATCEAATVDALEERQIDDHLGYVVDRAGHLDISFNAIGSTDPGIMGVPLLEQPVEQFLLPITGYARSYFLTARLAARRMVPHESGVIMTVTTLHSRTGLPLAGGYGPAQAAKEALTRQLSAELSPHGVRVVGLRPQAMPESVGSRRRFYESRAAASGMTWEQFQAALAARTHPRRLLTLREMSDVAVFMASDRAGGMTGTSVNLTLGSLDD
jgi:NAD(P)-dependent dehydrogenase (short-subunit alcohol dehydrogenase family)